MDKTSLVALGLFVAATAFLLLAGVIGYRLWRARRVTARHKALTSTF